jgi:hypothetical protein
MLMKITVKRLIFLTAFFGKAALMMLRALKCDFFTDIDRF